MDALGGGRQSVSKDGGIGKGHGGDTKYVLCV